MTKKIQNTNDPAAKEVLLMEGMLNVMSGRGLDGLIEGQERRGAEQLAGQRDQLPTNGSTNYEWDRLGFVWGEEVPGDPIFRQVKMPEGWSIKRTDHDMHSDLVDNKGRRRGGIFYKAAFYDRSARISLTTRYSYSYKDVDKNKHGYDGPKYGVVLDADGSELYRSEAFSDPVLKEGEKKNWNESAYEQALRASKKWLDANKPKHEDVYAYWDE